MIVNFKINLNWIGVFMIMISLALFASVSFTQAEITFDNTDEGTLITIPKVFPQSFINIVMAWDAYLYMEVDDGYFRETRIWYNESVSTLTKIQIKEWLGTLESKYEADEAGLIILPGLDPYKCVTDSTNDSILYGLHVYNGQHIILLDDPYCLEMRKLMYG